MFLVGQENEGNKGNERGPVPDHRIIPDKNTTPGVFHRTRRRKFPLIFHVGSNCSEQIRSLPLSPFFRSRQHFLSKLSNFRVAHGHLLTFPFRGFDRRSLSRIPVVISLCLLPAASKIPRHQGKMFRVVFNATNTQIHALMGNVKGSQMNGKGSPSSKKVQDQRTLLEREDLFAGGRHGSDVDDTGNYETKVSSE